MLPVKRHLDTIRQCTEQRVISLASLGPYSAPPIIEAVAQLVFQDALSDSIFRKLAKKLKRNYVNEVANESVTVKVDFQNRRSDFDGQPHIKISSSDEADILIVQPNSLTWSRLAPYEGWESFSHRIFTEVKAAHGVTGHRKLSRIGLRYINRLDVPRTGKITHYEEYLAINIGLPDELSVINNYAWRFERDFLEQKLLVIVQSAIVEPEIPDTSAFVLDIDVVATLDLPNKIEDIFSKFEEMRVLKNKIFELSIKDKARTSFSA